MSDVPIPTVPQTAPKSPAPAVPQTAAPAKPAPAVPQTAAPAKPATNASETPPAKTSAPVVPQTAAAINLPKIGQVTVQTPIAPAKPATNASKTPPAKVGATPPPRPKLPPKASGAYHVFSGNADLTADLATAVNAHPTMPAEVKALIAGQLQKRGHKIAKADIHVFESDTDWTITAHVKKIA